MKSQIISKLKKLLAKKYPSFQGEVILEYPPDSKMGDLGFPCFELAKLAKKSPNDVAKDLAQEFKSNNAIDKVQATGSYLNFFLNKTSFWQEVFKSKKSVLRPPSSVTRVMVEFSSPNTNKPLHLGHLRNNTLGDSVSRLLASQGHSVIKACLVNDRGIHICKSMLAYLKSDVRCRMLDVGSPKSTVSRQVSNVNCQLSTVKKGDHLVGDYYVKFNQMAQKDPKFLDEAQELLRKWEAGDKKVIALWKKMNKMVLDGFSQTYKRLGIKFDKIYFESQEYEKGRELIKKMLKAGKCYKREDGAIEIDLTEYGLDKKVLLRADGTSVYITQDLGLAVNRQKTLGLDKIIYVVGNEQDYHFKVLFKVLELFGFKWAKNLYHLSYAMVNLTTGKMKSREGTVVDADDIMEEMSKLARQEIKKREPKISPRELSERAEKIGLGALKFYLLKHSPGQMILYNPKESIAFEGATGPYLQYTYARIRSILRKSEVQGSNCSKSNPKPKTISNFQFPISKKLSIINYLPAEALSRIEWAKVGQLLNTDEEWNVGKLLARFNEIINESAKEYNPSKLCTYLLDLASAFNLFYHKYPVLKAESTDLVSARLILISKVAQTLKAGLNLLGIDTLEKM